METNCKLFWEVKILEHFVFWKNKYDTFVCEYLDYIYILFLSLWKDDIGENARKINEALWFMHVDSKDKKDGVYKIRWWISAYRLSKWWKYEIDKDKSIRFYK